MEANVVMSGVLGDELVSNCHDQKVEYHLVTCHLCDRVKANTIGLIDIIH